MKKELPETVIHRWMQSASESRAERFADLHVDQINEAWKARTTWIESGLQAHALAVKERDRLQLPFSVVLAFSLRTGGTRMQGLDFSTRQQLAESLDSSSPSLYLFERGAEPWRLGPPSDDPEKVPYEFHLWTIEEEGLLGIVSRSQSVYLIEFKTEISDEYSRTLFLSD